MLETIKSKDEISRIFSLGKRYSNRFVNFIVLNEESIQKEILTIKHDHIGRVAFIAGKKNGNAVWRNSAKRRMREICRLELNDINNLKILFIAKRPILETSFGNVLKACSKTLDEIFRDYDIKR